MTILNNIAELILGPNEGGTHQPQFLHQKFFGWGFILFILVALLPFLPYMRDLSDKNQRTVEIISYMILAISLLLAFLYWTGFIKEILFGAPVPLAVGLLSTYAFCNAMWMTEYDKKFVSRVSTEQKDEKPVEEE